MTQPCKICHGTGHVECPSQLCAHWCPCTVCNGTGKVEVYEDWSFGFVEEKVRASGDDGTDGPPVYVHPKGFHYIKPSELFKSRAFKKLLEGAKRLKVLVKEADKK